MRQPITITHVKVQYKGKQTAITAQQFKGAFNAYLEEHLTESLNKKKIPMDICYNRDERGKPIQRYPLVQFGTTANTLEVTGIGKGDIVAGLWLKRVLKENDFTINGKKLALLNPEKTTSYWYPGLLPEPQTYALKGWKPFDSETLGDEDRLNGIIWGNIHRMLGELGIKFTEKVHIRFKTLVKNKPVKGYHIIWVTYDAVFSTNINLPDHLGIGHEPSIGSGKIRKIE
jgi:hypothetical protein